LIYASSGAVYGNTLPPQKVGREEPLNIYGFSKLALDNLARSFSKKGDIPIVGLRFFNVYGEREFYKGKMASTILQFGFQLLKGEHPRLFIGSENIKRDFVYIKDVIQALIKASRLTEKKHYIFNVGTGEARSFLEVATILQNELGTSFPIEWIENKYQKQYQFFTQADIEETKKVLGYKAEYSLEAGIKSYLPAIKKIYQEELEKDG
jgi:ADP-L-glycero-D-manno-heptose 6-epimerase